LKSELLRTANQKEELEKKVHDDVRNVENNREALLKSTKESLEKELESNAKLRKELSDLKDFSEKAQIKLDREVLYLILD
jgi:hypothetical protein